MPNHATMPKGAMVAVFSRSPDGPRFLLLHNAEALVGDWEWGSPSGCREPGEDIAECAARELFEETGIRAEPQPVVTSDVDWAVYYLEVPWATPVTLSREEHDEFVWASIEDAHRRVAPERQAVTFRAAVRAIARELGGSAMPA
jgi:8-oxo-dGTP pyrophosphatase MutT (NUDIX family)